MSAKLMGMVFEAGPAEATQRFVLLAIADNCDDSGFAYPGVDLLAAKSCQTERNVLRILQALEGDGWLVIKRRSWGVKKRGNSYQLNLARLRKAIEGKTKPVYKASFLSGDKMSLRELREADSIGFVRPSGDKLSCEQPAVQSDLRGDIRPGHEVTNSTPRGDISGIPILKNHQEPSERTITPLPPQAGECAENIQDEGKGEMRGSFGCAQDDGQGQRPAGAVTRSVEDCTKCCAASAIASVRREWGLSNPRMDRVILAAMATELARLDAPEGGWQREDYERIAERMNAQRAKFVEAAGNGVMFRRPKPREFLQDGLWRNEALWPWDKQEIRELRERGRRL